MRNLDRVGIIQQVSIVNTNGSVTKPWTNFVTYPFAIESHNGNENVNADKMEAVQTMVITGRYFPGVTAQMRMVIDGGNWNIESVALLGRQERLRLTLRKND